MERQPELPPLSVALGSRAPASTPFGGDYVYRPGARLLALVLVVPVLAAVVGAALALQGAGSILPWLAAFLALWLLVIPFVWLNLKRVRLSPEGVEVLWPWRRGVALTWDEITRIRAWQGGLVLEGPGGRRLTFSPVLLRDGRHLRRQLLLRAAPSVLVGPLHQETQRLSMGPVYRAPTGELAGALDTCVAWPWRVGSLVLGVGCLGLSGIAFAAVPGGSGGLATDLLGGAGLVALWACRWLSRRWTLAESGIVLASMVPGRAHAYSWAAFSLVEVSSGGMLMRLRGQQSVLCPGPRLLSPRDRDVAESFVREYCLARGVARVVRRRFW